MRRLLILAAVLCLAACDMKPWAPWPDYGRCLSSHTETRFRPAVGATYGLDSMGGYAIGGIVSYQEDECDQYEFPDGDGPRYRADLREYQRELDAWHQRHPEDN